MLSILTTLWDVFLHLFQRASTVHTPRGSRIRHRAIAGGSYLPATRRAGALRRLLPLRGGLPRRLHQPYRQTEEKTAGATRLLPDQLLTVHLLRVLRGGLPDVCHPAHA